MPATMSYAEIADDIAKRIRAGEYEPGQLLPSHTELADEYGVSRSTASRAYGITNYLRITVGQAGKGVFVADVPPSSETGS